MPINLYALLGPVILILILIEFGYCLYKKNGYYSFQDSLMGIGTMMISQCVNLAIASLVLGVYGFIYEHFSITHLDDTLLNLVICYLVGDLLFYWFHRAGHRINILWAAHATHHSAEELNYAVALRTSFSQRAASFLFYWPLAVIGFHPNTIIPIVALNLLYQFLPHTRIIPRFPRWIDSWLNTPYHHRVHHAANPVYWDKNYGGTLIIWDKLFGSYQDEVEPIFYGITIHPESWDPTWLNIHWFTVLWKDMLAATHLTDKIKIWFMPPGWRPRNLPPFEKRQAKDAKSQIKYQTKALENSGSYLIFQLITLMSSLFLIISDQSPLSVIEKVILSFFIWLGITLWAAILESKSWAKIAEATRIVSFIGTLQYIMLQHPEKTALMLALLAASGVSLLWLLFFIGNRSVRRSLAESYSRKTL